MKKLIPFIIFDIIELLIYVGLGFLTGWAIAAILYFLSRLIVFRTYPEFQNTERHAIQTFINNRKNNSTEEK